MTEKPLFADSPPPVSKLLGVDMRKDERTLKEQQNTIRGRTGLEQKEKDRLNKLAELRKRSRRKSKIMKFVGLALVVGVGYLATRK